jgi:imidazole glycerol phosphate synthase subunit HisF
MIWVPACPGRIKGNNMTTIKIMPCLDMKDGRVVKGVNFVDLKDAGDPVENAIFYEKEGADELGMLDIAATVENRKTTLEWVKSVSSVISIPLTMGGGIASLEDIEEVFKAGAAGGQSIRFAESDRCHRCPKKSKDAVGI